MFLFSFGALPIEPIHQTSLFYFEIRVSLSCEGWPQPCHHPASAPEWLGLVCHSTWQLFVFLRCVFLLSYSTGRQEGWLDRGLLIYGLELLVEESPSKSRQGRNNCKLYVPALWSAIWGLFCSGFTLKQVPYMPLLPLLCLCPLGFSLAEWFQFLGFRLLGPQKGILTKNPVPPTTPQNIWPKFITTLFDDSSYPDLGWHPDFCSASRFWLSFPQRPSLWTN